MMLQEFSQDDIDTPASTPANTPTRRARSEYIAPVLQNYENRNLASPTGSDTDATRAVREDSQFVDERRNPGSIMNTVAAARQ